MDPNAILSFMCNVCVCVAVDTLSGSLTRTFWACGVVKLGVVHVSRDDEDGGLGFVDAARNSLLSTALSNLASLSCSVS